MRAVFIILGLFVLLSCAASQNEFSPDATLEGVETILILPFQDLHAIYGGKIHVDCVFCNRRHVVADVPKEAAEFMNEHLKKLLMNDRAYRFVFPDQTDEMLSSLQAEQNGVVRMDELVATIRDKVATIGDKYEVDAILMGYLFQFKERVGVSYSVESPASVSFSLFLVRLADGQVVWHGIFEETQQALSENILKIGASFKRKARWITARELAVEGLEYLISTFPKP